MINQSTEGNKTAVLLISGFLGAGKTTLLKQILAFKANLSDTVVLVNEFGDVGVDGSLLRDQGSDVIELSSGCICCSLSADLRQSLTRILNNFHPARILIESSGVADPIAVKAVLDEFELNRQVHLSKIVTVLDAELWEGREMFGPLFHRQLEKAGLILLNKIDLLDRNKVPVFIEEIHKILPTSQVVPTIQCRIDPETLWQPVPAKTAALEPFRFFKAADRSPKQEAPAGRCGAASGLMDAGGYVSFSFRCEHALDESRFANFVASLPYAVFRMKGTVRFTERTRFINFVGGRSQWSDWPAAAETRLAFIGWAVEAESVLQPLHACVIKNPR